MTTNNDAAADRAVPEPDADMVRVDRLDSILRMQYARGYQDAKKEMQVRTFSSTTINNTALLAAHAVPESDADAVVYTADDVIERMDAVYSGDDAADDAELIAHIATWVNKARRPPLHDISIASSILDIVQAAAGDDLDAMLRHLTDDDLPGKTLSIYRHDNEWGAQQHMTHLEEQYPTDVCGHGDGVLEAIADAVAKAKERE